MQSQGKNVPRTGKSRFKDPHRQGKKRKEASVSRRQWGMARVAGKAGHKPAACQLEGV